MMERAKREFAGDDKKIAELAEKLRSIMINQLGKTTTSTQELLRRMVEAYGGSIEIENDPPGYRSTGGSLVIRDKRDFTIFLSPYTSQLRDNFTICHELGHYFLHYDRTLKLAEPLVFNRYGYDKMETQSNLFAAALLMPEGEFKKVFKDKQKDIRSIAIHFGVSRSAAFTRAKWLGLIDG
jgi:Zn-dependent peptidase ImmA (M78 family)